jgi:hypothetical protein
VAHDELLIVGHRGREERIAWKERQEVREVREAVELQRPFIRAR